MSINETQNHTSTPPEDRLERHTWRKNFRKKNDDYRNQTFDLMEGLRHLNRLRVQGGHNKVIEFLSENPSRTEDFLNGLHTIVADMKWLADHNEENKMPWHPDFQSI